ncbi:serine/threonine-protein kinase [Rosistilla oblonga]|uniref:serine/threonine-protein kinase n=1 Tax=Rosistilla oblonga TaxID=2527990 RepID=UPI003A977735
MTDRTGVTTDRVPSAKRNQCVGIWRLLECFHQGPWTDLFYAQPAEAAGSPRADYVVKMVTDSIDAQLEGQLQLRQEATSAQAASHPNLIALLDARLSAPRPYVVFPRLDGQPLSTWLGSKYSQPLPVGLWWVRQAAQALQALHQSGWIHGDVKPDNMLVSLSGHLTVIDLGLSMREGDTLQADRFQGTPAYAAPEQIQGKGRATSQSDIYSLGIVFQQMLCRNKPAVPAKPLNRQLLQKFQVPESVVGMLEEMTSPTATHRPTAAQLVDRIFKLEIETLGTHIQPLDDTLPQAA